MDGGHPRQSALKREPRKESVVHAETPPIRAPIDLFLGHVPSPASTRLYYSSRLWIRAKASLNSERRKVYRRRYVRAGASFRHALLGGLARQASLPILSSSDYPHRRWALTFRASPFAARRFISRAITSPTCISSEIWRSHSRSPVIARSYVYCVHDSSYESGSTCYAIRVL